MEGGHAGGGSGGWQDKRVKARSEAAAPQRRRAGAGPGRPRHSPARQWPGPDTRQTPKRLARSAHRRAAGLRPRRPLQHCPVQRTACARELPRAAARGTKYVAAGTAISLGWTRGHHVGHHVGPPVLGIMWGTMWRALCGATMCCHRAGHDAAHELRDADGAQTGRKAVTPAGHGARVQSSDTMRELAQAWSGRKGGRAAARWGHEDAGNEQQARTPPPVSADASTGRPAIAPKLGSRASAGGCTGRASSSSGGSSSASPVRASCAHACAHASNGATAPTSESAGGRQAATVPSRTRVAALRAAFAAAARALRAAAASCVRSGAGIEAATAAVVSGERAAMAYRCAVAWARAWAATRTAASSPARRSSAATHSGHAVLQDAPVTPRPRQRATQRSVSYADAGRTGAFGAFAGDA